MQLTVTPEREAQLSRIATQAGRGVEDIANEALDLYLAHEQQFQASVGKGIKAARRGEFVSQADV